ncbi:amidohydrolase [Microbacterium sp. LWH3-1.2]|uniref:amidohydrolase n=1 Tax=Microbacterium sp. LWH3-1.2 TaxID=3135256 RepID=UPI0034480EE3
MVPGIIDGHVHAIRAGHTWAAELHWEDLRDPREARDQIVRAAATQPPGTWITVIGGWHPTQFHGRWLPDPQELDAWAPEHPVYLQALYEIGIASTRALQIVGEALEDVPGVERDETGAPTGRIAGLPAFSLFVAAAERGTAATPEEGTRQFFRAVAARGVTGVIDAGGFGMSADRYAHVRALHAAGDLDMRVRTFSSVVDRGGEVADARGIIDRIRSSSDDPFFREVGLGEIVHFGCHDFEGLEDVTIAPSVFGEFLEISRYAARARTPIHVHAVTEQVVDFVLTAWEQVDAVVPIRDLRFSIAHADLASPTAIARMRALGVGVILDGRQTLRAESSETAWGADALSYAPPISSLLDGHVPLGLGTDATRASSSDPWLALWWLVAGSSLDGVPRRHQTQLMTRRQALHTITRGNAWFTNEEGTRGLLAEGALADIAVLSRDYFTVERDAIPGITSDLTLLGGRPIYSSGAVSTEVVH